MVERTLTAIKSETGSKVVLTVDQSNSSRGEKLQFPVLKLEKVKKLREEQRELLKTLFPQPVRLQRLIVDIEKSFAKEFASIIGSVDFAEQRLARLIQALREILEKIEATEFSDVNSLREHITLDQRIHQSFEDLVFDCAQFSLQEVLV